MKRALTAKTVENIKPPKIGQLEIFDKGYPGLSLRVSYGGSKAWSYHYRLHGKLRRLTLGTYPADSLAEAREAWRKARHKVASGIDPKPEPERPDLFKDVAKEWLERDQGENRSVDKVRRMLERHVLPLWGHRGIGTIARRDVRDLLTDIAERGTVILARRLHSHLHRLFQWAIEFDIIESNPLAALPKPGKENPRDRVLTDDELSRVWNATVGIGWPFGPATQLLILTGARREEITGLRWQEIDGDQILLDGTRTKTGEPR